MPFCTQCGSQVQPEDVFCASCGSRQGSAAGGAPPGEEAPKAGPDKNPDKVNEFLSGMTPQNAALLCYVPFVGWVACIVMLAAERFRDNREVRFHAFQGLYVFVLWLFVDWVFGPMMGYIEGMRFLGRGLKFVVVGTWIFMLVKTSQGVLFRLPILGELADRSVSEQR